MREPDKSRKSAWWRLHAKLGHGLIRDEDGGVLIYMTILIPVMMGIIGLAVDASRLFILNTEQKDLADAAALAGARELDGGYVSVSDNALVRAENAARNVVTNNPRWGSDEPEVHIESIRFCETLTGPAHSRICDGYTTDAKEAYYIEVITEVRRVFPSFLVAVGAVAEPQSDALAIAGHHLVACNVQPLMLCNPYEGSADEDFDPPLGAMFTFKPQNAGGNEFGPGTFGLVDPPEMTSSGANVTRDLLSLDGYEFCTSSEVSPHPGHAVGMVNNGINVRFDYKFQCNEENCFADMTAAPQVIKAQAPRNTSCQQYDDVPGSLLYPDDTVFTTVGSASIGNGVLNMDDANAYWQFHHGDNWPMDASQSPAVPYTRYQAYLEEIEMSYPTEWGDENPHPQCLDSAASGADRRMIAVSIVNCLEWGVQGNSVNQIRVDEYAEFFITKPADSGEIYTEFIRLMTPDSHGSKIKRLVQLYR